MTKFYISYNASIDGRFQSHYGSVYFETDDNRTTLSKREIEDIIEKEKRDFAIKYGVSVTLVELALTLIHVILP